MATRRMEKYSISLVIRKTIMMSHCMPIEVTNTSWQLNVLRFQTAKPRASGSATQCWLHTGTN